MDNWYNHYTTQVLEVNVTGSQHFQIHLVIQRRDGKEVLATWSEIQAIKDEVVGEDIAMYEVFPKKDDIVDEVNKRHFWSFSQEMDSWKHL